MTEISLIDRENGLRVDKEAVMDKRFYLEFGPLLLKLSCGGERAGTENANCLNREDLAARA